MNIEQAYEVLGDGLAPGSFGFNNMIRALQMMPFLNTNEQDERLKAALWAKRNAKKYREFQQKKRDLRFKR